MKISELVEQLAGGEKKPAGDALVALGEVAVRPVLDVLCDEGSPVDWVTSAVVLRRIGLPALDPLIEAMATASSAEVARRCGWAHSGLEIDDLSVFVPGLGHPSPKVRDNTAYVLQLKGAAALPYVPDLIALLDDPDEDVRRRVVWALQEIGPGALSSLRDARRSSGRLRRRALEALVAVGGPAALDDRDRALIRRLIRVKLATETPEPMHVCGTWYAVPTVDQPDVLDAFGLSDPEPVTMRLGASAWNHDHHAFSGEHRSCRRVYVTPQVDGWTLLFGDPFDYHDEEVDAAAVQRHCRELSVRFGAAHWYGASCGDSWTAWCVAEKGEIVRYYDIEEPEDQIGSHPAEDGYVLPHIDAFPDDAFEGVDINDSDAFLARYLQVKKDLGIPDDAHATTVAARASVDPSALGPETDVQGHGVVALTPCGRERGHPRGALDI
ncbi:HEAT repeat domain-containing protein [Actinomadura madurae]|uniref:HEAT repeat domain-containing protein n=1 Tax=Actinomadura madurae TaxID=1993 RepID=UPI0020272742|nr:HEAT repeat domain-containing protein [Actinomadura madurae]URM95466.1 HEAT repeat domain-containing protein [Actinomadura madurae]URN06158.1 HEAT repeat domain-containing protein [Actinomadura madurae]